MDHRALYKARGGINKRSKEAVKTARAASRAVNVDAIRHITGEDEPFVVPARAQSRLERLKEWRVKRDLQKKEEALKKKKPFVTVVKKGIFLDKTNDREINKKPRATKFTKKKVTNANSIRFDIQTSTSATMIVKHEPAGLCPHVTSVETDGSELNPTSESSSITEFVLGKTPATTIPVELNSTFEVTSSAETTLNVINEVGTPTPSIEPAQTNENINDNVTTAEEALSSRATQTNKLAQAKENINDIDHTAGEASSNQPTPYNELAVKKENMNDIATPAKKSLNTSLNYVSPFVTVSRGKRSAQKEGKVRESLYKLETSQPLNISPTSRRNREAAAYFRTQVDNETQTLMETVDTWHQYKNANGHVDSIYLDQIDVAIGQTKLLISNKFNQFLGLVNQCENGSGTKPVRSEDLEGFWSMIYKQVDNCNERFRKLEILRANNWIEIDLLPAKVGKVNKIKKIKMNGVTASKGLRNAMQEARRKLKQNIEEIQTSSSSNIETANFSIVLRGTPTRPSLSTNASKTPKSIIKKTPGLRRITKNVVFASLDFNSVTKSPKAMPTPKPRSATRRKSTSEILTDTKHNMSEVNASSSTPNSITILNDRSSEPRRSLRVRRLFSAEQ